MGVPQTHGRALLYQSVRSGIEERRGTCMDPSSFILYLLLCLFLISSLHCPLLPPPLSPRPLSRSCTAKTPHCVLRSSPRQHLLRPPSQLKKLLPPPLLLQQKHHHHHHILAKELATDHTHTLPLAPTASWETLSCTRSMAARVCNGSRPSTPNTTRQSSSDAPPSSAPLV